MIFRGTVYSARLKMDAPLSVITPKQTIPDRPMRVCYLLHPLGGSNQDWLDKTLLPLWAEQYNTLFVMPDGQKSFYTDMQYGLPYYSYVSKELPCLIRETFRISPRREDTAVIGASMGGYGALRIALLHPEMFGFCGAISPAFLYLKDFLMYQRDDPGVLHDEFCACFGENMAWSSDYELTHLANHCGEVKPSIYLTVGSEDLAKRTSMRFCDDLERTGFSVRRESWEGEHDWAFFGASLKKTIEQFEQE